jgi:hypothetical protein
VVPGRRKTEVILQNTWYYVACALNYRVIDSGTHWWDWAVGSHY